ncbi:hypothetical protein WA026_010803 [Henosepilachna vigintioctopunctata]|uniref:Uncharacterized protein n=1 Tax=Henosepilachna vigintioctopunctata TaxID=420089 RepID=A0AAW1UWN0_9CUCU
MLKAVCWAICLCAFVQSITGKSIDFNSGYQDLDDKSTVLQTDVHENEQIEEDDLNGAMKVICKYAKILLEVNPDTYLKCIQIDFLVENRNIKLRKRSAEDDNTVPEVAEDNDNTIHEKEETATTVRLSDDLIVPAEISTEKGSENAASPVSEVESQESVTANTWSDDIIVPTIILVENCSENSSLSVNEITDHNVENPNIIPETEDDATTESLTDGLNVPAEVATENGSEITSSVDEVKSQEPATNKTSSDEVIVPTEISAPAEVANENGSEITSSVDEVKSQELATNKTSSDEVIVPIEISAPAEVATENGSEMTSVSEIKPQEPATNKSSSDEIIAPTEIAAENSSENPSLPVNPITDKPLSNNSLLTQESNILKINTINLKMLNSGETSDSTAHSSLNSTTDTPVLFKNGFDDILKNTPGKQQNISIKEDESPKGTLGSKKMQTVLLEVSKNDSSKTIEGGEISKAGESQEKSTSSPNNILLIVFAILGVVGTLAFAFNYIKKRREDREVNEMIKLEEEGRELKEIKPLMKSNFVQNGSKSLEYIDADPQLQVQTETKDERN